MDLKELLVHVDDCNANAPRVAAAVALAAAHDARLTGVYVLPGPAIPIYLAGEAGPALVEVHEDTVKMQMEHAQARAAEAEAVFKAAAEKARVAAEWRCEEGSLPGALTAHAGYVDLVMVSQSDADDPQSVSPGLLDKVVIESGRPVLVIPAAGVPQPIGRRVMVAWNESREATRAVYDARDLLARAEVVDVVTVTPDSGEEEAWAHSSRRLCRYLERHGIQCTAHSVPAADAETGAQLLAQAQALSADLVVMGGYGHSRLREIVLGGSTRYVLKNMSIPVLMVH